MDENMKKCEAILYHGPGHQSRTKCQRTGKHKIHFTIYRYGEAYWVGDEGSTGYFDEPPEYVDVEE